MTSSFLTLSVDPLAFGVVGVSLIPAIALGIGIRVRPTLTTNCVHLRLLTAHLVLRVDAGVEHGLLRIGAGIALHRTRVHGRLLVLLLLSQMLLQAIVRRWHGMLSMYWLRHSPGRDHSC